MNEIDAIRALERQLAAIQARQAADESINAIDSRWLAARARRRRDAALHIMLRLLFRLPLKLWRRARSAAIPPARQPSAGLRGR